MPHIVLRTTHADLYRMMRSNYWVHGRDTHSVALRPRCLPDSQTYYSSDPWNLCCSSQANRQGVTCCRVRTPLVKAGEEMMKSICSIVHCVSLILSLPQVKFHLILSGLLCRVCFLPPLPRSSQVFDRALPHLNGKFMWASPFCAWSS